MWDDHRWCPRLTVTCDRADQFLPQHQRSCCARGCTYLYHLAGCVTKVSAVDIALYRRGNINEYTLLCSSAASDTSVSRGWNKSNAVFVLTTKITTAWNRLSTRQSQGEINRIQYGFESQACLLQYPGEKVPQSTVVPSSYTQRVEYR